MKIRLLKVKHWLLISIMSVLGLSSCDKQSEEDMYGCPETPYNDSVIVPMYGVPEAQFNRK